MKIILMLKINVKNRVIKNNKIVKKISFLVLLILIIYLSIYDKVISKTIQKKLAINFIKNMFKNHLNNNKLKASFNIEQIFYEKLKYIIIDRNYFRVIT